MADAMRIEFKNDQLRQAAKRIGKDATRAVPLATAEALSIVAARARKAEIENLRNVLDRATPFVIMSVRFNQARRDGNDLVSNIYVAGRSEPILYRLEMGGREKGGIGIADKALENRYGSLNRGKIDQLLRKKGNFEATINGTRGIYRRAEGRTELLVAFLEESVYEPQLGYFDIAREVGMTFEDEAVRQLDKSMRRLAGLK